jgi:hypothetical protein
MKSNNNSALAELNEKLMERKEEQRAKYKNSIVDRDKNYAHGMMLAYGQAAAMVRERMAEPTHEDSVLPIQLVSGSCKGDNLTLTGECKKYGGECSKGNCDYYR